MNGSVTVLCVKHHMKVQLIDGQPGHYSWGVSGTCDSEQFIVRRERWVTRGSALHELQLKERAAAL